MLDSNLLNRAGNAVKTFGSKKVKGAKNLGKKELSVQLRTMLQSLD